jgi:hypothetical protein
VPTQNQIDANRVNSRHSTGPKTASGKAASARNAMKHGMTAKKFLTPSESAEEFEALYAARRKLYPPDDAILDRLIRQITLADFRVDRGFEAEANILQQGSLAEVLVQYDKPIKQLSGYEANNRRTRKQLEEELTRYLSMRNEAGNAAGNKEPEPRPPEPKDPFPKRKKSAQPASVVKAPASPAGVMSAPTAAIAAASNDGSTAASSRSAAPEPGFETNKSRKTKAAACVRPAADVSVSRNDKLELLPLFAHVELSVQVPPSRAAIGVHQTRCSTSSPSASTAVPALGSAPRPAPVPGDVRIANRKARSGTPPPISSPAAMASAPAASPPATTFRDDQKTRPMLPSGGQAAPISPPVVTPVSRSSASPMVTAPVSAAAPNPPSGGNLKTKPMATSDGTTRISPAAAMAIVLEPALPPPTTFREHHQKPPMLPSGCQTPVSPAAEIQVSRSSASPIVTASRSALPPDTTSGLDVKAILAAGRRGKTAISPPAAMAICGSSASSTVIAAGSPSAPDPTSRQNHKTKPIGSIGSQTPISPPAMPPPSPPGPPAPTTPPRRWPLTHDLTWNSVRRR